MLNDDVVSSSCLRYNAKTLEFLRNREAHTLQTVVLSSRSNLGDERNRVGFLALVTSLRELSMRVILVSPTVEVSRYRKCLLGFVRSEVISPECSFDFSIAVNHALFSDLKSLSKLAEIQFIDLSKFMCDREWCNLVTHENTLIVRDQGHFANEIELKLSEFLAESIQAYRPPGDD